MNNIAKKVAAFSIAAVGGLAATPALSACYMEGPQLVPPHSGDFFRKEYMFSGSALGTLEGCLKTATFNEEIPGRDITLVTFNYSSSSQGHATARGYSAQPGDDLTLANKPGNSVSIAHVYNTNGAHGLTSGNIVEWAPGYNRVQVYANWPQFQQTSPYRNLFPTQP